MLDWHEEMGFFKTQVEYHLLTQIELFTLIKTRTSVLLCEVFQITDRKLTFIKCSCVNFVTFKISKGMYLQMRKTEAWKLSCMKPLIIRSEF